MAYIDKDLLLKDIEESVVFSVREDKPSLEIRGARKIIDRIEDAPTADVVEVVRCKGCKYWDIDARCNCIIHEDGDTLWDENDFCSYGERRKHNDSI